MTLQTATTKGSILVAIAEYYDDPTVNYDQPGCAYDSVGSTINELFTLSISADIRHSTTQTLQIKANIPEPLRTFSAKAHMALKGTGVLTAKGRVQHGASFTLSSKAHVVRLKTMTARGHLQVVTNQSTTIRGHIRAMTTRTIQIKGRVLHHTSQAVSALACISRQRIFTSRGRISQHTFQTSTTKARIRQYSVYTTQSKGRIDHKLTLSIQADIRNTVAQTNQHRARLRNVTHQSTTIQAHVVRLYSLTTKSRIRKTSTQTGQAKARVAKPTFQSIGIRARCRSTLQGMTAKGNLVFAFTSKARISQQQGWPIPTPVQGNYFLFQPTQLKGRASIVGPLYYTQLNIIKGRINWDRQYAMTTKARIVLSGHLQSKASIKSTSALVSIPATFSVLGQSVSSARVIYYVGGRLTGQTNGIGAMIQQSNTARISGHFTVRRNGYATFISVDPSIVRDIESIGIGAYIN